MVNLTRVKQTSLTHLDTGTYRDVYLLDDERVVKFNIGQYDCNAAEIALWEKMIAEHGEPDPVFARIYEWSGEWLIMERVPEHSTSEQRDEVASHPLVRKYGADWDIHSGNVRARADGTACIIDYGHNDFLENYP